MRIALGIEYDGSRYHGWQRQDSVISVQQELEQALSIIANHPVELNCAGRTDSGVHATGQVVDFETDVKRRDVAWTLGVNANLPKDIAVRWFKVVDDDFHARFSATARRYRYVIYNNDYRPAILGKGLTFHHLPLNEKHMDLAAQALVGENDFTSFRATKCQSNSPNRCVHNISVKRYQNYVVIDIQANAFVHHMVRNIVGSLIKIGEGEKPLTWMAELLEKKDRKCAAATAKAAGLYLVSVDYPEKFDLPEVALGPLFLS